MAQAARSCAGKVTPEDLDARTAGKTGLWGSFVKWSYKWLGDSVYPVKADICNCGADLGVRIPKPELIRREGVETGSREYKMQLYGAALYYHMATMTTEVTKKAQPDMLRDKDVLEVACMRGGGARYLAEVVGPRRYLGTDNLQEHIDRCRRDHGEWPGLEFQVTDAHHLAETLPAESFDFVLCIQAASSFEDPRRFIEGVHHVLRPGGRLMLADALSRDANVKYLDALEDLDFDVELAADISRAVHAVGLCQVPKGLSYMHIVAKKE